MNIFSIICLIIAVCAIVVAVSVVINTRKKEKTILSNINSMLERAINGVFSDETFDESKFSAIESKMAQFLSLSEFSYKNISSEKDKIKELISDISHQTKTPIANILLYTQILNECNLPKECEEHVEILSVQAEKLSLLVDSLVKASRLETGIIALNPEYGEVSSVIESAVTQAMARAKAKNIEIHKDEASAFAYFDNKWTAEAIYNIIDNAIKYSPENSSINTKVLNYEMFCRIDIADEGIGIGEGEQSKVFQRFFRSNDVSSEEGVGIGLYLTKEIITSQGGYIVIDSKKGEGTIFSVYLPKEKR